MPTKPNNLKNYSKWLFGAKLISAAFFLMYGVVPFLLNEFQVHDVFWADISLRYSIVGAMTVLLLPNIKRRLFLKNLSSEKKISISQIIVYFTIAFILFSLFPWHDDRESVGAQIASIFRAIWLVIVVKSMDRSESFRQKIFFLSLVLMATDESRTYFMIVLSALALRSEYFFRYMLISFLGIVLVAATRMGVGGGALAIFLYGIVGESYNATRPVGQILQVREFSLDWPLHLIHTFVQPLILPVEILLGKIGFTFLPQQSSYFSELVTQKLGETLSPMGGWYIPADFVYYGASGYFLFILYLGLSWLITNYLLNTRSFPIGAFVFMISIKATPYVYWKFVLYIFLVSLLVSAIGKMVVRHN